MKKIIVGTLAVVGGVTILAGIATAIGCVLAKKRWDNLPDEEKERRNKLTQDVIDILHEMNQHDNSSELSCSDFAAAE